MSNRENGREAVNGPTRAGPKGQFIWPPVSVQSGSGTVSIRARHPLPAPSLVSSSSQGAVMSSTPVAQLAAVFSSPHSPALHTTLPTHSPSPTSLLLPPSVSLPQEPVPPSELGLTLPPDLLRRQDSPPAYCSLPATLPTAPTAETMLRRTEDIVKQQEQQIEELQRALSRSQQQLQSQQSQLRSGEQQQQLSGTKQLLAHQLQSRQLASQIQQLQQEQQQVVTAAKQQVEQAGLARNGTIPNGLFLNNKFNNHGKTVIIQEQNSNIVQQTHKPEPTNGHSPATEVSDSMDDVLEILMKNGDLPTTVSNSRPKSCKVPPAPPLPLKNSPMEFPQLDLADMNFDFGQLPDLPAIFPGTEEPVSNNSTYDNMVDTQLGMAEVAMDVDMDVADWLDSLVVPSQNNQNSFLFNHVQR